MNLTFWTPSTQNKISLLTMSIWKKTKLYCTYDEISKNSIKVNTVIWLKTFPAIHC